MAMTPYGVARCTAGSKSQRCCQLPSSFLIPNLRMSNRTKTIWLCSAVVAALAALFLRAVWLQPASQVPGAFVAFDVSPVTDEIVFSAEDGDLYRLETTDRNLVQITKTAAVETAPSFSPDGRRVVYARENAEGIGSSIYAQALDGSQLIRLTSTPDVCDSFPSFSADGSQIVFARAGRHRPYSLGGMTWDNWDVWTVNSDGTDLRRLTDQKYYELLTPHFTRDGARVIYSANTPDAGTTSMLYAVGATDTRAPELLVKNGPAASFAERGSVPRPSRDGTRIAFLSDSVEHFHYDIVVMDPAGNSIQSARATKVSKYNWAPVFSADGQFLVFLAGRELGPGNRPRLSLWRMGIDGTNPKRIATHQELSHP